MEFEFIDPRRTPFVEPRSRGELPHLYKEGGSYFVTFRLWDAVEMRRQGAVDLSRQPAAEAAGPCGEYQKQPLVRETAAIVRQSEPPLRLGSCILEQPPVAEVIQKALLYFHGDRYFLAAWCVMPNHVHAVVIPGATHELSVILHSWKSFTAHQVNKMLKRQGPLWERESFDHLIRTVEQFDSFIDYVEKNPVEAGLSRVPQDWLWSSARFTPLQRR